MRTIAREDLPDLLLGFVVSVVVVMTISKTTADPDLWGHIRFGQDILAAHFIPRHDTYSFTSDRPWVNHEWLAEVCMAGAYRLGNGGLVALKVLLGAGFFVVTWRALRHAGVHRPFALGVLIVLALATAYLLATLRPQVFSLLIFAVLLSLLNEVARGRPRLLLWMPALFATWANLHGGWVVGLGTLGLWMAGALSAGRIGWPWAVAGTGLGLVGTLGTPYGLELWRFLRETVGLGRANIADWQPLIQRPALLIPWAVMAALVAAAWQRSGKAALPALVPVVVVGALSLRVVRLEGFFAVATVILLAPCFAAVGPARLPLSRRPSRVDIGLVGAICLVGLVATGVAVRGRVACVTITGPGTAESWAPEAEAVHFLRDNRLHGRLLAFFDYGELAIWHLAPRLLVSYDGRRETVYSAAVQARHAAFYLSTRDASYARALKADYIWLPRRLPVVGPLERDGWTAIFRGSESVVFARVAGTYKQPAPLTGPRCFPGP